MLSLQTTSTHAGWLPSPCAHISPIELTSVASDTSISHLVAQVYETAVPELRSRLLEHLLKPLGVLALFSVANGIFAKLHFRTDSPDVRVRVEDVQNVQASDVIALVDRVQQISVECIDRLAQMIIAYPVLMTGSAAAAMLVTVVRQRARFIQMED
jgi:hypothetical protein